MRSLIVALLFPIVAMSQTDPDRYVELGFEEFGEAFNLVVVEADGALVDATFIALSKKKPSKQAKRWARLIRRSANEPTRIMFAGESSAKTAEVLRSTLKILQGRDFQNLDILFLGSEQHAEQLKELTEGLGANFRFVVYGT